MSKEDINIKITTTADTSGTEKVEKSILAVEDATKQAERELDVLEAKRRQSGGLTGIDLTGKASAGTDKLIEKLGYKQELEAAKALGKSLGVEITGSAALDAAAIAGSFAAIGASAVVAFKGVSDSLNDYKNLMTRWREATGKELDDGSKDILAYAQVFNDIEQPIDRAIDKIGGFISTIGDVAKHPLESLKNLRKELDGTGDLEAAIKRAEDAKRALEGTRQARAEAAQIDLTKIYGDESIKLHEQEETMKRISRLRGELGSLEVQGARQEVDSAKLRGGDVALAEANLLATEIRTGLGKLQGELGIAKQNADAAQQEADAALVTYNAAIRDGLKPEKVAELGNKVDQAQIAANDARQALSDQSQIFSASKNNLLRGAENSLAELENEYSGKTSNLAKNSFDGIYESIKQSVSEAPKAAINRINAEGAVVTATADSKAAEVNAAITNAAAEVDQKASEISGAFERFRTTIANKDARFISGLESLTNSVQSILSQLAATEQRIASIESRAQQ